MGSLQTTEEATSTGEGGWLGATSLLMHRAHWLLETLNYLWSDKLKGEEELEARVFIAKVLI